MKKIVALILALVMCVGLLCACTPTEEPITPSTPAPGTTTPNTPAPGTDAPDEPVVEDPAEISVILWANGTPPTAEALALVNEKINEITVPEINVIVNLQIWDVGTYIGTAATAVGAGDDIEGNSVEKFQHRINGEFESVSILKNACHVTKHNARFRKIRYGSYIIFQFFHAYPPFMMFKG